MKNLNYKKLGLAACAIATLASAQAFNDGPYSLIENHRFAKPMFSAMTMPNSHIDSFWGVKDLEKEIATSALTRGAVTEPSGSFNNLNGYSELMTPDGIYFVTSSYTIKKIPVNEFYTQEIITGFEFTFYDSQFKKVGTIKDNIVFDKSKGESDTAHCLLDTSATRYFFNDDDNLEVMVYLGIKTGPAQDYHPNFYEKVYSLGGEKDAEGNDVCLYTMEGRLVDTVSGGDDDSTLFTMANDVWYSASDYPDPVERAKASTTVLTVYGKGADGTPQEVYTRDIKMVSYPGDTTDGLYIITKTVDGVPYFIFPYYEKPYFINPIGGATDERATHDNNFVIDVLKYENGKLNDVSQTKIPVEIDENGEQLMYIFYSVGNLTWKGDIDFIKNGTKDSPAFIIEYNKCTAANLESVNHSYDFYNTDGQKIRNVALNAESFNILNSAAGEEPHLMFVVTDENGEIEFQYVDLYSGTTTMTIPQVYKGESLMASCERIKGDDGKYKYAILLQTDALDDETGNIYKRIAWFNSDGELDHIDRANMGPNVQASTVNLTAASLSPYLYDDDDAMEYAILIKKTYGETTRNEFIIVDDSGEWYAHFTADDGRGEPMMFTLDPRPEGSKLYMIYAADKGFNIDVYELPFVTLGIDSIFDDGSNNASFENGEFIAPGSTIAIYTIGGTKVAYASDNYSTENLPSGIYVAVLTAPNGERKAVKFAK